MDPTCRQEVSAMPISDDFLLTLLKACESLTPKPLVPRQYAEEQKLERGQVDAGLDELRGRGLVNLTEWMPDIGQGVVLTEYGLAALKEGRVPKGRVAPTADAQSNRDDVDDDDSGRSEAIRQSLLAPHRAPAMRVLFALILAYFFVGAVYALYYDLSIDDYLLGNGRKSNRVLIDLGALHPALVVREGGPARPQLERIVLFTFLHIGGLHLFMNLYFLNTLGRIVETIWGTWRFVAIYAISGIVSGCAVLLITIAQTSDYGQMPITAGASGCMYGIFVSMIVWFSMNYRYLPDNLVEAWSRSLRINTILLIAINFLPSVSWQGHFGGAVGGFLAAYLLHVHRHHATSAIRRLALLTLPIVPIAFFIAVLYATGWL